MDSVYNSVQPEVLALLSLILGRAVYRYCCASPHDDIAVSTAIMSPTGRSSL